MKRAAHDFLSGAARRHYGVMATFENERGDTLTGHRTGPISAALAELCDAAEKLDPTYLAVCISTPTTILRDLQGRAPKHGGKGFASLDGDPGASIVPGGAIPEYTMLAHANRHDRIHPRLLGHSVSAARRRRISGLR